MATPSPTNAGSLTTGRNPSPIISSGAPDRSSPSTAGSFFIGDRENPSPSKLPSEYLFQSTSPPSHLPATVRLPTPTISAAMAEQLWSINGGAISDLPNRHLHRNLRPTELHAGDPPPQMISTTAVDQPSINLSSPPELLQVDHHSNLLFSKLRPDPGFTPPNPSTAPSVQAPTVDPWPSEPLFDHSPTPSLRPNSQIDGDLHSKLHQVSLSLHEGAWENATIKGNGVCSVLMEKDYEFISKQFKSTSRAPL